MAAPGAASVRSWRCARGRGSAGRGSVARTARAGTDEGVETGVAIGTLPQPYRLVEELMHEALVARRHQRPQHPGARARPDPPATRHRATACAGTRPRRGGAGRLCNRRAAPSPVRCAPPTVHDGATTRSVRRPRRCPRRVTCESSVRLPLQSPCWCPGAPGGLRSTDKADTAALPLHTLMRPGVLSPAPRGAG